VGLTLPLGPAALLPARDLQTAPAWRVRSGQTPSSETSARPGHGGYCPCYSYILSVSVATVT